MTAVEAAPQRGDEDRRFEVLPAPGKGVTARPTRTVVVLVAAGWALASFGFVGLTWLLGAKGEPLGRSPGVWDARQHVVVESLPGAGVFTRVSILGFPLHWAFVGIGSVAFFIALAILYNLHVDRRAEDAGALPESRRPEV